MPDEDRVFDLQCLEKVWQGLQRLVVHEPHRAPLLHEHVGLSIAVAVVDERAAAGRADTFAGKSRH